ncbi:MarR family transcriptional regulator [Streptomyces sp. NPDC026673]|uniref:MarR family transcriptional regulator n=1 Tax=Streptomyces sp. NPDC026673 TaxID=3155724 RepID=UPI003401953F
MPARNAAHGLLGRALSRCRDERATGVLRVQGSPGGAFHLLGGSVVAVESPGAPGVGTLLVRSGRIDAEEWNAAHDAAGTALWPGAAIAGCGRLGTAEFQVLHMMAVQDAVFAVLAGRMDDCAFDPAPAGAPRPVLPPGVGAGVEPEELLVEGGRRIAALAALPHPVSPDRDRVAAVGPPAWADEPLAPVRREILGCANGRRSPRDIAFLIGRGVYTITVEVTRMRAEGMVDTVPPPPAYPLPPPAPPPAAAPGPEPPTAVPVGPAESVAPYPPAVPAAGAPAPYPYPAPDAEPYPYPPPPPRGPEGEPGEASAPGPAGEGLPRREPGASGIREALDATRPQSGWKGFLRPRGRSRPDSP